MRTRNIASHNTMDCKYYSKKTFHKSVGDEQGWRFSLLVFTLCLVWRKGSAETLANGCPVAANSTDFHLPHPTRCDSFLRCDHGIAKEERCPGGLHFNPALQVCDWPQNANCRISSSTPTTRPSTAATTTTPRPFSCSGNDSLSGVLRHPHETNCQYYYMCQNGKKTLYTCKSGYHFSPTLLTCKTIAEANCVLGVASTTSTSAIPSTTTSAIPSTTTSAIPSTTTSATPSTTKTIFSSTTTKAPVSVTCSANYIPDVKERLPHENNCQYYYICLNGKKTLYTCTSGYHFSPTLLTCKTIAEANCVLGMTPTTTTPSIPSTTTSTIASTTTSDTPSTTTSATPSTTKTIISSTTTKAPVGLPVTCSTNYTPGVTERLPHETNCQYYYICLNGNKTLYTCKSGYHFSPTSKLCELVGVAGCGTSPSPIPGTSTTSQPTTVEASICSQLPNSSHGQWSPAACSSAGSDLYAQCYLQCDVGYGNSAWIWCSSSGWVSSNGLHDIPECDSAPTTSVAVTQATTDSQSDGICSPLPPSHYGVWVPESCGTRRSARYDQCYKQCNEGYGPSTWIWCSLDGWYGENGLFQIGECVMNVSTVVDNNDTSTGAVDRLQLSRHTKDSFCEPLALPVGGKWSPANCSTVNSEIFDFCDLSCDTDVDQWGWLMCTADGWLGEGGLHQIPRCI